MPLAPPKLAPTESPSPNVSTDHRTISCGAADSNRSLSAAISGSESLLGEGAMCIRQR